jgi:hypothetical protein
MQRAFESPPTQLTVNQAQPVAGIAVGVPGAPAVHKGVWRVRLEGLPLATPVPLFFKITSFRRIMTMP